jgi:hypothetical protein
VLRGASTCFFNDVAGAQDVERANLCYTHRDNHDTSHARHVLLKLALRSCLLSRSSVRRTSLRRTTSLDSSGHAQICPWSMPQTNVLNAMEFGSIHAERYQQLIQITGALTSVTQNDLLCKLISAPWAPMPEAVEEQTGDLKLYALQDNIHRITAFCWHASTSQSQC